MRLRSSPKKEGGKKWGEEGDAGEKLVSVSGCSGRLRSEAGPANPPEVDYGALEGGREVEGGVCIALARRSVAEVADGAVAISGHL